MPSREPTPSPAKEWSVVSTGHSRELAWLAWALAERGALATYAGPFPDGRSSLPRAVQAWPLVDRELAKRRDSPGIDSRHVRPTVTGHEVLHVALGRLAGAGGVVRSVSRRKHERLARTAETLQSISNVVAPDSVRLAQRRTQEGGRRVVYAAAAHRAAKRRDAEQEVGRNWPAADRSVEAALDSTLLGGDVLWTLSSYAAATYRALGVDESKMLVCGLGVDTARFHPGLRRRPTADRTVRVLYAGRVTRGKGVTDLAAVVRALGPAYELVVIGLDDGSVSLPDAHNIVRKGHLASGDLAQEMADADIVALPSYSDAFGLTGLEAMASGRATILSTNTFGPDVVQHGRDALLFEPGDREHLAALLESLTDPAARQELGTQARATAERQSWSRVAPRLAAALQSAVAPAR